jgi:hypothetical protein
MVFYKKHYQDKPFIRLAITFWILFLSIMYTAEAMNYPVIWLPLAVIGGSTIGSLMDPLLWVLAVLVGIIGGNKQKLIIAGLIAGLLASIYIDYFVKSSNSGFSVTNFVARSLMVLSVASIINLFSNKKRMKP